MSIYVEVNGKMECTSKDMTVHDLLKVAVAGGMGEGNISAVQEPVTTKEAIPSTAACIKDTLKQLKEPNEVK